jgi:basic membrane protein A
VGTGTTATADETTTAGAVGGGAGSGEGIRVGLVTDVGKVNDGTFNQFAYQGLQRAQEELGVEIEFIETQQPTDYERNLDQFANQDFDLVVGVGFLMGDAIAAAAARHPDVNFAIVDFAYETPPANVKGLVFQEDQAGYLAGAMASLVSQNRVIGVVGGVPDVPAVRKFVEGYAAGANAIAEADGSPIDVRQVYIPSFTDPAGGAEAARSQIAEGADVIFGAGGQTGSGAIQAAAQQGAYVIGVDQDEYVTTFRNGSAAGADRIITSAIKRVDNAVFDTIQSVVNGTFNNELYVGNAANQGIGYAPAHGAEEVVTQEVINRLEDILEGLSNGSIQTGVEQ